MGKLEVVNVGAVYAGLLLILIEYVLITLPIELVALILNVNEPVLVGVPLITPVERLNDKPVGSDPLYKLKVIGAVPLMPIVAE